VGDFLTTSVGGVPVVVVRDREGRLRAHVNVCRHRGHAVAVGQGNRRSLQCRYHGWTYDLSGCLRAAPRSDEGLDFVELGLLPAAVDTWAGFVFVSVDPAEPLASFLGELPQIMAETGYGFPFATGEELTLERRFEFRFACNWKSTVENSLECYHCPTAHSTSFSDFYRVDAAGYLHENYDRGFCHTAWLKDDVAERFGLARDRGPDLQIYFLWPTMAFTGGDGVGAIQTVTPVGPEESVWALESYARPGADDPFTSEVGDMLQRTLEEDVDLCASVHTGLRSKTVRFGKTLAASEANIRHFQWLTWKALAPAFEDKRSG
jgi:choline monooxygenase